MTTYTDRLGLAKPETSDPVNVTVLNNNMDRIDDLINMVIGLPANLADAPNGQLLFDEAQDAIALKAHGELIYLAPRIKPQGLKAKTISSTNSATFSSSQLITDLQATFTAEVGRRYVVSLFFPIRWVSGGTSPGRLNTSGQIRWAQAPTIDLSSTQLFTCNLNVFGPVGIYRNFSKTFEFFPNVNAQVTIGLTITNPSTQVAQLYTGTAGRNGYIWVRDYGTAS